MNTTWTGRTRRYGTLGLICGLGAAAGCTDAGPATAATECSVDALTALDIPRVTIASAELVPAAPPKQEYCDVTGSVATDGEGAGPNSAGFEVMLPTHWNGKYMFSGVRGTGGSLNSAANPIDLEQFMVSGYASVTSDQGHTRADGVWYATSPGEGNMPKLVDYFYRAVHQVTLATKDLVKAYYAVSAISYAYFDGCSNGGREAVMEAARYPEDYDGIIAGSSWLDPLGTALADLKNVKAFLNAHIPRSKVEAIDAAIFEQCDELDGVKDGLIQNPMACSFKPEGLVPGVLTMAQAQALNTFFSPVRDVDGNLVYPGSPVGHMNLQFGTPDDRTAMLDEPPTDPTAAQPWGERRVPHLWRSAEGVLLTLGYRDPSMDMNNTIEEEGGVVRPEALELLYERLRANIVDDAESLNEYFEGGGKLILYHGLSDPIINGYSSVWFYEDLADLRGGYEEAQEDARLFLIPDTYHCNDGPEPTEFNTLTALENWVEKGVGPDAIPSTKMNGETAIRTMPLCKFPEMAHYSGTGDVMDGQNWSCDPNDESLLERGYNGVQAGMTSRDRHTQLVRGTPGDPAG